MATNANFPPYEYHEGGEIVGIDVEIAQAIAEKLDKELKIEDMEFAPSIDAVASGKADMGVAGMTVREDRLENCQLLRSLYDRPRRSSSCRKAPTSPKPTPCRKVRRRTGKHHGRLVELPSD